MAAETGPTVRRRELGATLRHYRTYAGLGIREVAERLYCSTAKISRIETGHRNPTLRDVRDLCDMYRITEQSVRDRLMTLARESRQPGWWQPYDLDPGIETLVGLETAAVSICDYQTSGIPAMLQTAAYAQAILRVWHPEYSSGQLIRAVDLRIGRQRILSGAEVPRFRAIVDEGVLRRTVGGPSVMSAQLTHLADLSESLDLSIQVIPFTAGAHQGMASSFVLLDFAEPTIPSVIYVEGMVGNLYVEQAAEVTRYRRVFTRLGEVAMGRPESLDLVRAVARELAGR